VSADLKRLEGVKPLMLKDKEEVRKSTQKYDDRDDEADELDDDNDDSDLDSRWVWGLASSKRKLKDEYGHNRGV
jgi:hypothetical protein